MSLSDEYRKRREEEEKKKQQQTQASNRTSGGSGSAGEDYRRYREQTQNAAKVQNAVVNSANTAAAGAMAGADRATGHTPSYQEQYQRQQVANAMSAQAARNMRQAGLRQEGANTYQQAMDRAAQADRRYRLAYNEDLRSQNPAAWYGSTLSREQISGQIRMLERQRDELQPQVSSAYDEWRNAQDDPTGRELLYEGRKKRLQGIENELATYQQAMRYNDEQRYDELLAKYAPKGYLTDEMKAKREAGRLRYQQDQARTGAEAQANYSAELWQAVNEDRGMDARALRREQNDAGYFHDIEDAKHLRFYDYDVFYALYADDPEAAKEWARLAKQHQDQQFQANLAEWAGQDTGTRLEAFVLGTGANWASGVSNLLDPFSENTQEIGRAGRAMISGGAQGLTEKGIFNTGLLSGTIDEDTPLIGHILGGKGLGDLYSLGSSILESTATAAVASHAGALSDIVQALGVVIMGSSAASADYDESLQRGLTEDQAMQHAMAAGINEAAFEWLSLDKLVNPNFGAGVIKQWLTQSGIEASEEFCTTVANRLSDGVLARANGYDTQIEQRMKELIAMGVDHDEARERAEHEWTTDLINDAIGGFISGGFSQIANVATGYGMSKFGEVADRMRYENDQARKMEQRGAAITNQEELQALQSYAKANGIQFDQDAAAKLSGTGGTDSSASPQNDNGKTDSSADRAAGVRGPYDASAQNDSGRQSAVPTEQRLSRKERRQQAKSNRSAGAVQEQVVRSIAESVKKRGLDQAQAVYDETVSQHGHGIARQAAEAVSRAASEQLGKLNNSAELEQAYKKAAESVTEPAVRKAIDQAYNMQSYAIAQRTGNEEAVERIQQRIRNTSASGNRNLSLDVQVTNEDGSTSTAQITGVTPNAAQVKLSNGQTVDVDQLTGVDADTKDVLDRIKFMEVGPAANLMWNAYQLEVKNGTMQDGYRWIMDYTVAFDQGRQGSVSLEQAIGRAEGLSPQIAEIAYQQGRDAAKQMTDEQKADLKKRTSITTKGATGRAGTVNTDAIANMRLSEAQKKQLDIVKRIAEVFGIDVEVFASGTKNVTVNGKKMQAFQGENGSYENGRIRLDINAGLLYTDDIGSGLVATMGHELTHFIQEFAPEEYRAYKEFVLATIARTKGSQALERLIQEKIDRSKNGLSRSAAEDEVVADAAQTVLTDSQAIRQMAEQAPTLFEKVLQWIKDFFNDIRDALAGSPRMSEEARLFRGLEAEVRKAFGELWDKGITEAVRVHDQVGSQSSTAVAEAARDVEAVGASEQMAEEAAVQNSDRIDAETLEFLDNQEHVTVYRAMQLIDGQLYPPMAAKVEGKLVDPTEIGEWYQAVERPDLIDPKTGKWKLDKANGKAIKAAYNPYFHTSATPLNDQFSSAYNRPNIVVVEGIIPKSELTSGYKAQYAKDSVGETKWHAGPVASKLKGKKSRRVFLSRWFQAQRVVSDAEVADVIAKTLEGENISIPNNVVTPSLLEALRERGVAIDDGAIERFEAQHSKKQNSDRDTEYLELAKNPKRNRARLQEMVDEAAKKAGYTIKAYHGTANAGRFNVFDAKKLNNSKLSSHIGQGFYFTNSKSGAQEYMYQSDIYGNLKIGKKPYLFDGYIKLQNPIEVGPSTHTLSYEQIRDIVADGDKQWFFSNGIPFELQNKEIQGARYSKNELSAMSNDQKIDLYARYLLKLGDMEALSHMVDVYSYDTQGLLLDAMKKHTEKDGIHWEMKEGLDQFVVFDSSQFKESSPVTYDDAGNVIPLSERFNTENQDIRYSERSTLESAGLTAELDENGRIVARNADGEIVTHVNVADINRSGIGALINYAATSNDFHRATISKADARIQKAAAADLVNMILKTNDAELVWRFAGSALFSAVKSNSDGQYGTTIDFSTVCRKTQEMVTAMSEAMMKLKRGLTKDEVIQLQKKILEEKGTVPCPVCYVFSRWAGVGGILDNMYKFQQKYGHEYDDPEVLQARIRELEEATKTKANLRAALRQYDTVYMKLAEKVENLQAENKSLNKQKPRGKTAQTPEGIAQIAEINKKVKANLAAIDQAKRDMKKLEDEGAPELAWLKRVRTAEDYWEHGNVPAEVLFNLDDAASFADKYNVAWGYRTTRGPSAGKAILPYSDMQLGDLIMGPGKNRMAGVDGSTFGKVENGVFSKDQNKSIERAIARTRAQNLIGGQRYQSTSDFRYDYGLDYIQSFWEAQALGSNMQTYTKIVEFAELVATVGGDVNLSVMPLNSGVDENGYLVYSSVTGINAEAAIKISRMYDSAQLILVGINDDHILTALDDFSGKGGENVGFVIPYHASGASINRFIRGLVENLSETFNEDYYKDYSPIQTDSAKKVKGAKAEQVEEWMEALRENPTDPAYPGRKPTAAQQVQLEQMLKAELREAILKHKIGSSKEAATDLVERSLDVIRGTSKDISGMSFEELRAIEQRALQGDASAIREYTSWSDGVLWDLYNKMWVDESNEKTYGVELNTDQAHAIMPHEYWNKNVDRAHAYINGFIFRSYCYNLGLTPRFTGVDSSGKNIGYGDFSDSTGYWKTLIDRAMYDNQGKYRDQQTINATRITKKMLTPEYGEQRWGEYKVREPSDVTAKRAAERFVDEVQTQYSMRDYDNTLSDYDLIMGMNEAEIESTGAREQVQEAKKRISKVEGLRNKLSQTRREIRNAEKQIAELKKKDGSFRQAVRASKAETALARERVNAKGWEDIADQTSRQMDRVMRQNAALNRRLENQNAKQEVTAQRLSAERVNARAWERNADLYARQLDKTINEKRALERQIEKQLQREEDILSGKLKPLGIQRLLRQARDAENAKVTEQKEQVFENYKDRRRQSDLRQRIKNLSNEMKRRMTNPSERAYVPASLYGSMTQLADVLDDVLSPASGTKAEARYRAMMDAIHGLAREYEGVKNLDDSTYASEYDEEIREAISDIERLLERKDATWIDQLTGDTVKGFRELDTGELQRLYDLMRQINYNMIYATRMLGDTSYSDLFDAMRAVADQQNSMESRNSVGWAERNRRTRLLGSLSVMRAVEMMSGWDRDAALYQLVHAIEQGADDSWSWVMDYNKSLLDLKTGKNEKEYRNALTKKLDYGVKDEEGQTALMTKLQALQILMTAEREEHNDKLLHLQTGGAVIRNATDLQNGKGAKARSQTVKVTPELLQKIQNDLTPWDKAYMKTIRDYFQREGRATNEILYKLKHKVLQTEEYYVPYNVDSNYLETNLNEQQAMNMWVRMPGSTNALKQKAKQPVIIDGMDTVMARHVKEIADYIGMAIPIRDFSKVYNGMIPTGEDNPLPVKETIDRTFGKEGQHLLTQAVIDVQGGRQGQSWRSGIADFLNTLQSAFVKSALLVNPSVTIKQAASYVAAESILSHRAIVAGNRALFAKDDKSKSPAMIAYLFANPEGKTAQRIYNEIDRHTSLHYQRRQGMSQAEIAEHANRNGPVKRWMNGVGARMEQNRLGHAIRRTGENLNPMAWIQRMDVATTATLWLACKHQAKMDLGITDSSPAAQNDAFWKHTTELYERVIRETQPMYDGLHRTAHQKQSGGLVQFLFPFRTVPIQNHGQLAASYEALKASKGKSKAQQTAARKFFAKTVWAQTASAFIFSLMTFIAAGLKRRTKKYRDEDEEFTAESFAKGMMTDIGATLFSVLQPMYGSELVSWGGRALDKFEGTSGYSYDAFSVGVVDMLNDLISASDKVVGDAGKLFRGEDVSFSDISSHGTAMLLKAAKIAGIPADTVKTYAQGLLANVQDLREGRIPAINDESWDRATAVNVNRYAKAWEAGDSAKMQAVIAELNRNLERDGKSTDGARDAVSKAAKELYEAGEVNVEEYMDFLRQAGYLDEEKIQNKVRDILRDELSTGDRSEEDVIDGLVEYVGWDEDKAWKKVQEWSAKAEHAEDEDYNWSQYDEIHQAIDGGKDIKGLVAELVDHGVAEKNITQNVKSYLVSKYEEKGLNETQFRNMLSRYCGIVAKKDVDEIVNNANCYRDSGYHYNELREAYNSKKLEKAKAQSMLQKYGGMTAAEAKQRTRYWDFQVKYPDAELSQAKVDAYYDTRPANFNRTMQEAGISMSDYIRYATQAANATGTDADGDGKTDSGSKKAAIMQIINALPLSANQKDALYYLNGWSAKTLKEAPWH